VFLFLSEEHLILYSAARLQLIDNKFFLFADLKKHFEYCQNWASNVSGKLYLNVVLFAV